MPAMSIYHLQFQFDDSRVGWYTAGTLKNKHRHSFQSVDNIHVSNSTDTKRNVGDLKKTFRIRQIHSCSFLSLTIIFSPSLCQYKLLGILVWMRVSNDKNLITSLIIQKYCTTLFHKSLLTIRNKCYSTSLGLSCRNISRP